MRIVLIVDGYRLLFRRAPVEDCGDRRWLSSLLQKMAQGEYYIDSR